MKRILMLLGMLVMLGCEANRAEQPNVTIEEKPIRFIILGLDATGSYKFWDQAKLISKQIIMALHHGDVFYVRTINAASYLDKNTIFKLEIPAVERPNTDNPFDKKSKLILIRQNSQLELFKKGACDRLSSIQFANAQRTDIYGFLQAASDRFQNSPKGCRKILIIASDLKDNVNLQTKPTLSGVSVVIIGFQVSQDPIETKQLKDSWRKRLTDAGANDVTFWALEEGFKLRF